MTSWTLSLLISMYVRGRRQQCVCPFVCCLLHVCSLSLSHYRPHGTCLQGSIHAAGLRFATNIDPATLSLYASESRASSVAMRASLRQLTPNNGTCLVSGMHTLCASAAGWQLYSQNGTQVPLPDAVRSLGNDVISFAAKQGSGEAFACCNASHVITWHSGTDDAVALSAAHATVSRSAADSTNLFDVTSLDNGQLCVVGVTRSMALAQSSCVTVSTSVQGPVRAAWMTTAADNMSGLVVYDSHEGSVHTLLVENSQPGQIINFVTGTQWKINVAVLLFLSSWFPPPFFVFFALFSLSRVCRHRS